VAGDDAVLIVMPDNSLLESLWGTHNERYDDLAAAKAAELKRHRAEWDKKEATEPAATEASVASHEDQAQTETVHPTANGRRWATLALMILITPTAFGGDLWYAQTS
jgi:hypothetical protein